jgi:glycosyltransferase involved in cell wall biosynthesis
MGVVCQEYFRSDLGGFGGYGKTVQNLLKYYGDPAHGIDASVIISSNKGQSPRPERRNIEGANFIFLPSLLKTVVHAGMLVRLLYDERFSFFLSLDYELSHEYLLWAAPEVPHIIYIRDPRSKTDWERIATVRQEIHAHNRRSSRSLIQTTKQHSESFKRIRRWSRRFHRPIFFVSNGRFLVERERDKLGLSRLCPEQLLNPIPLPAVVSSSRRSRPMLLAIGRLDPQKRPWVICELARRIPEIDFILAGSSNVPAVVEPLIDRYRKLPNLQFTGPVFDEKKEALFSECSAFLNTSIHEGLPVTFLEAFSYGKCVISSVDPEGLVSRFGYFTGEPEGDGMDEKTLRSFESAIMRCLRDVESRHEKETAAREYVLRHHSFSTFEKTFKKILQHFGYSGADEAHAAGNEYGHFSSLSLVAVRRRTHYFRG